MIIDIQDAKRTRKDKAVPDKPGEVVPFARKDEPLIDGLHFSASPGKVHVSTVVGGQVVAQFTWSENGARDLSRIIGTWAVQSRDLAYQTDPRPASLKFLASIQAEEWLADVTKRHGLTMADVLEGKSTRARTARGELWAAILRIHPGNPKCGSHAFATRIGPAFGVSPATVSKAARQWVAKYGHFKPLTLVPERRGR